MVALMRLKAGKERKTLRIEGVVFGRINGVVTSTGGCYYKKMYGHFAGKKSVRNKKVVALRRWS